MKAFSQRNLPSMFLLTLLGKTAPMSMALERFCRTEALAILAAQELSV
jgi:hypothetical protein